MIKRTIRKASTIILPVGQGLGKNIAFTAVLRNFKLAYPNKQVFVIASFGDTFLNNPYVDRLYRIDNVQHLYEDYIKNRDDVALIEVEPYRHPEYLSKEMHLVEAWCDLLEIPCKDVTPEFYLTKNEKDLAKAHVKTFKKPLILLQYIGGLPPQTATDEDRIKAEAGMYRRSFTRDTTDKLVKKLTKDGYMVGSVQFPNQYKPEGAELINHPIRSIIALLPHAAGVIAIDSFLQHASVAMGVKALVCWAGTSPNKLGYKNNINIRRNVCSTPECHRPNSFAFDILPNGYLWDCPFNDICKEYDVDTIYNAYKEMKGKSYKKIVKDYKPGKPVGVCENSQVRPCK